MNRRTFLLSTAALAAQEAPRFGRELEIVKSLEVGMTVAAEVSGNTLFTIGGGMQGSLTTFDISEPAAPSLLGKLPDLGHVRQLVVRNGIAYVTSREDGLFIIDVQKPEQPALLNHYDTIELATGLAISGNVAYVACRQCGVELIDITDPKHPAHLSTIRVGEAQSVTARSGYLYAGVWGTRELVICDVRNPRRPVRVGKADLDGFGDGVAVRGSLCYVATGHHAMIPGNGRPAPNQPQYGTGHGMEIFDISRPDQPKLISRIKTRPRYRIFMDMWSVKLSGKYAFLADTYNGLFVIDVEDPAHPRFVARRQLPEVTGLGEGYVPTRDRVPSPVCGLAIGRDYIYAAGGYSDMHVVEAKGLAAPAPAEPDSPPAIPRYEAPPANPHFRVYQPGGQIREAAPWGKQLVLAAGNAGFHTARFTDKLEPIDHYETEGIAYGADTHGDTVYIAEGMGGLSIWRGSPKLKLIGRHRIPGQSVKQVAIAPNGRYAMLHVGLNWLRIVNISDPKSPFILFNDTHLGLFYQRPISTGADALGGLVNWGIDGLFLYPLSYPPTGETFRYPVGINARNGAARYGEGWQIGRAHV